MTTSLCLSCAAFKDGPWAFCPACAFQPSEPDDLAKAMILSEEKYTRAQLEEMRVRHQQGEPWSLDGTVLAQCKARMDAAGVLTEVGQREKLFNDTRYEAPGNLLVDRILIPVALLGIPLLPLESMGRGTVKVLTLGTVPCGKDAAWMIGMLAYLLWVAAILLLVFAR